MAPFASPEWIDELARAAADVAVDPGIRLTVEQRIIGEAASTWHVTIADGVVRVVPGSAPEAEVTLTSSFETAAAIHGGRLSAQRAFLDGALRIGGDLRVLIAHRSALAGVAPLLGGVT